MIYPLTSLRFFFAFFVFASHLFFYKSSTALEPFYNNYLSEGFLGVSFFFILSGFILSMNYKNIKIKDLVPFYKARVARIYPTHFLMLLLVIVTTSENHSIKNFIANLLTVQSFSPGIETFFSYNAPSWSISDEFFFYALFPFLALFFLKVNKFQKALILTFLIGIVVYLNLFLKEEHKHYYLYIFPLIRLVDFIIGMMLFEICVYLKRIPWTSKKLMIFQIISVIVFILTFSFHDLFNISYRYSCYYWLSMVLIITSFASPLYTNEETFITKILSNKILVYLGYISFSFYMIHLFIIELVDSKLLIKNYYLKTTIILFITLIMSSIVYHYIEKPFNKLIKTL